MREEKPRKKKNYNIPGNKKGGGVLSIGVLDLVWSGRSLLSSVPSASCIRAAHDTQTKTDMHGAINELGYMESCHVHTWDKKKLLCTAN